jgi:ADP-heptose:LPS heptosyltransferase
MLAVLDLIARPARLAGVTSRRATHKPEDVKRILVIEPKNIGDVVLTLPFLAQLRARFPDAKITMLSRPIAEEILEGTGLVDEFIHTNLGWSEEATRYNPLAYNWRELARLRRELPARRFDLAFKCCMHIREHIVIGLSGAQRRIGYAFGLGDRVLTDAVPVKDPDRHKAADWLELVEYAGVPARAREARLHVSQSEREWANDFLANKGISTQMLIGIHPGASVPGKRWPLERFREIAATLAQRDGVSVIAFVDPENYGESLADVDGVIAAKVTLRELIALTERCRLLVCNDSGPMHIAGALGIPTVAVFGTGINLWFAPLGDHHRLVTLDSPVSTGESGARTIRPYDVADIPTSRVLEAVNDALAS